MSDRRAAELTVERDRLDLFDRDGNDPRYVELLAKRSIIQDFVRDLPVVERQDKDSLTVTVYDGGDCNVLVADCPEGGWCEAAYVFRQTAGTINPPGVDVVLHSL